MLEVDERLFSAINGLVGRFPPLDRVLSFLANDYFIMLLMSFLLLVLWFLGDDPGKRRHFQSMVLWSAGGMGIATALVKISNELFFRPRPFGYLHANLLFYQPHDSSFPSNAAAVVFAVVAGIWLGNRKLGLALLPGAVLFAFARVYSGVHFPLDVVGGAALGVASSYLVFRLCRAMSWLTFIFIWLGRLFRLA